MRTVRLVATGIPRCGLSAEAMFGRDSRRDVLRKRQPFIGRPEGAYFS